MRLRNANPPTEGTAEASPASATADAAPYPADGELHLVVCAHGFLGNPSHLDYMVERLRETTAGKNVIVHNSTVNSLLNTMDGIDLCGERITKEIKDLTESLGGRVKYFTIIGYSQGGLNARYAVGRLLQDGYFTSVTPVNFITFATPHIGICRPKHKMTSFQESVMGTLTSTSGSQMLLRDDEEGMPLLLALADPDGVFYQALSLFKNRILYANAINDRTVPYCTAAIEYHNPYRDTSRIFQSMENYPHIIDPELSEALAVGAGDAAAGGGRSLEATQSEMFGSTYGTVDEADAKDAGPGDPDLAVSQSGRVVYLAPNGPTWREYALGVVAIPLSPVFLVAAASLYVASLYSHRQRHSLLDVHTPLERTQTRLELSSPDDSTRRATWRKHMLDSLNALGWRKHTVYIDGLNSHGPIIARNLGSRLNPSVTDAVNHMAASLQLV